MLEDFVAPSTAQRLRSCILGSYLDTFSAGLFDLGHKLSTIRSKLWVVSDLTRWMCKKRLAVVDLDERRIDEYLEARRRRGRGCRGFGSTALRLLDGLRSDGMVRRAMATLADSPVAALLARYEGYLRRERALQDGTIAAYQSFVRAFAMERLDANAAGPNSLRPGSEPSGDLRHAEQPVGSLTLRRAKRGQPRPGGGLRRLQFPDQGGSSPGAAEPTRSVSRESSLTLAPGRCRHRPRRAEATREPAAVAH